MSNTRLDAADLIGEADHHELVFSPRTDRWFGFTFFFFCHGSYRQGVSPLFFFLPLPLLSQKNIVYFLFIFLPEKKHKKS